MIARAKIRVLKCITVVFECDARTNAKTVHRQSTLCVRGLRESMRVMNKVLKIAHLNHISV